tara:strand:+ start:469 stop:1266 length:798 start_codon:yes stop_codon:yes gene_type:complete
MGKEQVALDEKQLSEEKLNEYMANTFLAAPWDSELYPEGEHATIAKNSYIGKYESQFGDNMYGIGQFSFTDNEEELLESMPLSDLFSTYQNIAEQEWGPLDERQKVNPKFRYQMASGEDVTGQQSVLKYLDDLISKNKLLIYSVDNFTSHQDYGKTIGQTHLFRPDLNPTLDEGPDTLFIDDRREIVESPGSSSTWMLDPDKQTILNAVLHELGHTKTIDYKATFGEGTPWPANSLIHNTESHSGREHQDIWQVEMTKFINKYVK